MYYTYILRCSDDTLYTGITTNICRRIREHNGELKSRGARYTRNRRPVTLVFSQSFKDRSGASREESRIKQLTRAQKIALIKND